MLYISHFKKIKAILLFGLLMLSWNFASAKNCFVVMSYHQGYEWNDGVEKGIVSTLKDRCKIDLFYMDTKNNKTEEHAKSMALKAKQFIDTNKPDIVITVDDDAAQYLIKPFYKDSEIPFVFCGINWTADKYGFPYQNVTGMLEVAPIIPVLQVIKLVTNPKKGVYLGADTTTEQKNYAKFNEIYNKQNVAIDVYYAKTMDEWESMFEKAQGSDFLVLGSSAGIESWSDKRAKEFALKHSKVISVTNHSWMEDFSMYSMNKVPEEQGEWAAEVAIAILNGAKPSDFPIRPNQKWLTNINKDLFSVAGIKIPNQIQ